MNQAVIIFVIVLLFNIFYSYNGNLYGEELNRAKQIGIGTNFSGIDLRYWLNNDYALQVGANYSRIDSEESVTSYRGSITNIFVLKKKICYVF